MTSIGHTTGVGRRRGFSLMELLAVMAIMALLTTLSVTSYFGAVRSMTRRSAVKHFVETLRLARQRACIENARVSVVLFNDVTGENDSEFTPSYVLCREIGRVSFVRPGLIADEFTEIDKIFGTAKYSDSYRGSIRLYNLNEGRWSNVYPWVEPYEISARYSASGHAFLTTSERQNGYSLNAFAFRENPNAPNKKNASWEIGDPYGIEAAPIGTLPRNFQFSQLSSSDATPITVTFSPDGTAKVTGGATTFRIVEMQPPNKHSDIKIKSTGDVDYDGKWQ